MNKRTLAPQTLPLPQRIEFNMQDTVPLAPVDELSTVGRLRLVTQCFGLSDVDAAAIISAAGELVMKNGKPILQRGSISRARFAQWVSGYRTMPLWRMGAAIAALEHYALEKTMLYIQAGLTDDDPRVRSFVIGQEELHSLSQKEKVSAWVFAFRGAILQRLKLDARTDPTAKQQLGRYLLLLKTLKKEEEEEGS